jgi:hypothetical protein
MVGMMIVLWGAVIVLAAWVIWSIGRSTNVYAMAILRKRLAATEIQGEYEKTKRLLQG